MTGAQFDALVQKLERRYARAPGWLQLQLVLWIALGYLVFLVWLAAIALGLAAFAVGATLPFVGGIWLILIGGVLLTLSTIQLLVLLGTRLPPPKGRLVTADEVPRLFALIDEVRQQVPCRVHQVALTHELNAAVMQRPRLGFLGWSRNCLILGIPLLAALTPDEFRSVLAHEFGHLTGRHGRFTRWVYRLRQTWERLFAQLHHAQGGPFRRWLQGCTTGFIDWYWPRFNARAFVLCRAHEYFADANAARIAGTAATGAALWHIACFHRRLEDQFWTELFRLANTQSTPPEDLVARMAASLATAPDRNEAQRWMEQTASRLTDNLDTHPCCSDRLSALGLEAQQYRSHAFPTFPAYSAADELLATQRAEFEREVSANWHSEIARDWRNRHGRVHTLQRRLETIDATPSDTGAESPAALWEKACTLIDIEGAAAAEAVLQQILEQQPDHERASLVLGRHWLEKGRPEGEDLLHQILDGDDEQLVPQAGELLAEHFRSTGATDRLQLLRHRLDRFAKDVVAAQRERTSVKASDIFLPHDLEDAELASLRQQLQAEPELHGAWLVQKELRVFSRRRLFVLCVRSRWQWLTGSSAEVDSVLSVRIAKNVRLPGRVLVISPHGGFAALARKVMRSPESEVVCR
jgi:Zn-dependent protease with chaperone function